VAPTTIPPTTTLLPSSDEITPEIIEEINYEELSDAQIEEVAEAIQEADDEVKEAFEEEVNIFAGATEEYIPAGSTVSVEDRRAIIAVQSVSIVAAAATRPVTPTPAPSTPSGGPSSPTTRRKND
jgi:hypothetical protein